MQSERKPSDRKVTIGINFSENLGVLVDFAKNFARHTQTTLRLVHAIEPHSVGAWFSSFPNRGLQESQLRENEKTKLREARSRLSDLAKVFENTSVETHVDFGSVDEVLLDDAIANDCQMIVIANKEGGISNTSLVKNIFNNNMLPRNNYIPLLLIPSLYRYPTHQSQHSVLCADDLSVEGLEALEQSVFLASFFKNSKFYHCHIYEESEESLAIVGDSVLNWMNLGVIPYEENFQTTKLADRMMSRVSRILNDRYVAKMKQEPIHETEYSQIVEFGDVKEKLNHIIDEIDPTFIVFGQHRFIHKKPFSLGKVSLKAMSQFNRPLLICPRKNDQISVENEIQYDLNPLHMNGAMKANQTF